MPLRRIGTGCSRVEGINGGIICSIDLLLASLSSAIESKWNLGKGLNE